MQLASQVPMNVMFIAIAGKVYKYDLVSKECLFEFNTFAHSHMIMYDFDDKLLVADSKQVRLWDFFNHKDEVPELVTVLEAPIKVEHLKVNFQAEDTGDRKNVFYYIISCDDIFKVYHGRLELLLEGDIDNRNDHITSIEFGIDTQRLFIGTSKGLVHEFELPSPKEVREDYKKPKSGEAPKARRIGEPIRIEEKKDNEYSISLLYRVTGILEENFFAMHVQHSGLWVWNADESVTIPNPANDQEPIITNRNRVECIEYKTGPDIDQIKATPDGRFLVVGFPGASKVVFYEINQETINLSILEPKITIDYTFFETDDNLTVMLFNNSKLNTLSLYAIQWIFDLSKVDVNHLKK